MGAILAKLKLSLNSALDRLLELSYKKPWVYPVVLAILLPGAVFIYPAAFVSSSGFVIGPNLPSERAIPMPVLTAACEAKADGLQSDPEWLFRYSPTGTESGAGLPYWIYKVLPDIFPEDFAKLGYKGFEKFGMGLENEEVASGSDATDPNPANCGVNGKYYQSFPVSRGLVFANTPVRLPFLKGEVKFTRLGLNCSACHRGGVKVNDTVRYISAMPSHSFGLWSYERYLADLAKKPAFNDAAVIQAINARLKEGGHPPLNTIEELLYGQIVNAMKSSDKDWEIHSGRTAAGSGRIDAFDAFKFSVAKLPDDGSAGPVDYPGIWNQRANVRSWHHYDGNTASSSARNRGSTVGVGSLTYSVRVEVTDAIGNWLNNLPSPAWPFAPPDDSRVKQGETIYKAKCAHCHGWLDIVKKNHVNILQSVRVRTGPGEDAWRPYDRTENKASQFMQRIALKTIGTDPERFNVWRDNNADEKQCLALGSAITNEQLQKLGTARDQKTNEPACRHNPADEANAAGYLHALWEKTAFRPTTEAETYLAGPLDGTWAKAPYLHNGSVPTMRDLLRKAADRPAKFVRGRTAYNEKDMGFETGPLTPKEEAGLDVNHQGGGISVYETSLKGNRNTGHEYAVDLSDADKDALLEYLKTL